MIDVVDMRRLSVKTVGIFGVLRSTELVGLHGSRTKNAIPGKRAGERFGQPYGFSRSWASIEGLQALGGRAQGAGFLACLIFEAELLAEHGIIYSVPQECMELWLGKITYCLDFERWGTSYPKLDWLT